MTDIRCTFRIPYIVRLLSSTKFTFPLDSIDYTIEVTNNTTGSYGPWVIMAPNSSITKVLYSSGDPALEIDTRVLQTTVSVTFALTKAQYDAIRGTGLSILSNGPGVSIDAELRRRLIGLLDMARKAFNKFLSLYMPISHDLFNLGYLEPILEYGFNEGVNLYIDGAFRGRFFSVPNISFNDLQSEVTALLSSSLLKGAELMISSRLLFDSLIQYVKERDTLAFFQLGQSCETFIDAYLAAQSNDFQHRDDGTYFQNQRCGTLGKYSEVLQYVKGQSLATARPSLWGSLDIIVDLRNQIAHTGCFGQYQETEKHYQQRGGTGWKLTRPISRSDWPNLYNDARHIQDWAESLP